MSDLINFKLKINIATGHDLYEALREGIHDDLVLSVALAMHVAKSHTGKSSRVIVGPTQEQISMQDCADYHPHYNPNSRVILGKRI